MAAIGCLWMLAGSGFLYQHKFLSYYVNGQENMEQRRGERGSRNSLRNMLGNVWSQSMKQFVKEISKPGYLNL